MRLARRQIEAMHVAIQDVAANEFDVALDEGGKLRFSAIEVVERLRPVSLTKLEATNGRRALKEVAPLA